jgi:hypothetical protein
MIEPLMPMTEQPAVSARPKRKQRVMQIRFPATMNFGITAAMAIAIEELCGPNSPFTQSDVGRMALHSYLLGNSASYQHAIASEGMRGNGA